MSPLSRSPSELQEQAGLAGTRAVPSVISHHGGTRSPFQAPGPSPAAPPARPTGSPLPLAPATSPNHTWTNQCLGPEPRGGRRWP